MERGVYNSTRSQAPARDRGARQVLPGRLLHYREAVEYKQPRVAKLPWVGCGAILHTLKGFHRISCQSRCNALGVMLPRANLPWVASQPRAGRLNAVGVENLSLVEILISRFAIPVVHPVHGVCGFFLSCQPEMKKNFLLELG